MHPSNQLSSPIDWGPSIPPIKQDKLTVTPFDLPSPWDNALAQNRPSLTWGDADAQPEQRAGTPERAPAKMSLIAVSPLVLPDGLPRFPARKAFVPGTAPLLNSRHERFAQMIALGRMARNAYMEVYDSTPRSAEASSSRLLSNAALRSRVAYLQAEAAKATVLTLAEKRKFLRDVVTTPIYVVDETNPLCQSAERTKDGSVRIKMPDKLRALELDAKLAGELKASAPAEEAKDTFGPMPLEWIPMIAKIVAWTAPASPSNDSTISDPLRVTDLDL